MKKILLGLEVDRFLVIAVESVTPEGDGLTYDVLIDTLLPPVQTIATGVAATSFSPKGLIYGRQYYWRIKAKNTPGKVGSSEICGRLRCEVPWSSASVEVSTRSDGDSAWRVLETAG
jgi:hypothetical protein